MQMHCTVCGRYVGRMQVIWDHDPVICNEACAERASESGGDGR